MGDFRLDIGIYRFFGQNGILIELHLTGLLFSRYCKQYSRMEYNQDNDVRAVDSKNLV